ncbi:MAG: hypothetical protein KY453_11655 [Gemmatimonadetes bacterium]|nr:hypothetical protein [Gemmatimonadota bacterium]
MSEQHGAATIKEWMQDLVELARSGRSFNTSAGAEPHRSYAYLEYHLSDEEHSILLFKVEAGADGPEVRAHRFDGTAESVRDRVDRLTHGEG